MKTWVQKRSRVYQKLYFYNPADKSLEKRGAVWYNMYSIRKEVDTYG